MRLITVREAVERYSKSKETINSTACQYKKATGVLPKWYVKQGHNVFIDIDEFEKHAEINRKAWVFNTDSDFGIYWILTDIIGLSQWDLSGIMAKRSHAFNRQNSWSQFFTNSMFSLPEGNKAESRYTMNLDFFRLGSRLVYEYIKKGQLCQNVK